MMTPARETLSRRDSYWAGKHEWKVTAHEGAWQRQVNAGGCRNFLGTYTVHTCTVAF